MENHTDCKIPPGTEDILFFFSTAILNGATASYELSSGRELSKTMWIIVFEMTIYTLFGTLYATYSRSSEYTIYLTIPAIVIVVIASRGLSILIEPYWPYASYASPIQMFGPATAVVHAVAAATGGGVDSVIDFVAFVGGHYLVFWIFSIFPTEGVFMDHFTF